MFLLDVKAVVITRLNCNESSKFFRTEKRNWN